MLFRMGEIMRAVFLTSLILVASSAWSQDFKVLKTQGSKVLIQVDNPDALSPGRRYSVASEGGGGGAGGTRVNSIGISSIAQGAAQIASFSSKVADAKAVSHTVMSVRGTYGWNKQNMEFGPIFGIYQDSGTDSLSELDYGGYFDFNLVPNTPGQRFVYGVTANLEMLSTHSSEKDTSGSTKTDYGQTSIGLGGQLKFFPGSGNFAIRLDGLFRQSDGHTHYKLPDGKTGSYNSNQAGLYVLAGLSGYF